MSDRLNKLSAESIRIEEDSEQSAKRHFNAASRWSAYHFWLGLPSVVIATAAGAAAFKNFGLLAGGLAFASAALTAILTFLKPSERAKAHNSHGNQYLALRNQTRLYRELEIGDTTSEQVLKNRLSELAGKRDELNMSAPLTAERDYVKANQGILQGQANYKADNKRSSNDDK